MAESDVFNISLSAFSIYMGKYSSMSTISTDVISNLDYRLSYVYPLS